MHRTLLIPLCLLIILITGAGLDAEPPLSGSFVAEEEFLGRTMLHVLDITSDGGEVRGITFTQIVRESGEYETIDENAITGTYEHPTLIIHHTHSEVTFTATVDDERRAISVLNDDQLLEFVRQEEE